MAEYETVEIERIDRVGIIRLNRPQVLNAFNSTMLREWMEALQELNEDPSIGAIISTGNGRAYSSGGDFRVFEGNFAGVPPFEDRGGPFRRAFDPDYLATSKPIIGAINGVAVGAAATSMLWFDVIIASTQARFSMRFSALGLTPVHAGQWILPRITGLHHAREMLLTGRFYSAEEARELGLVRRVVEPERLMKEALALANEIAANPPEVLRALKKLIHDDLVRAGMHESLERADASFDETRMAPPHREAVTAFREKRPPHYYDGEYMRRAAALVRENAAARQTETPE